MEQTLWAKITQLVHEQETKEVVNLSAPFLAYSLSYSYQTECDKWDVEVLLRIGSDWQETAVSIFRVEERFCPENKRKVFFETILHISFPGYGNGKSGIRMPAGTRYWCLPLDVETDPGSHSASHLMGTGNSFTEVKQPGVTLTTHLDLEPGLRMGGVTPPLPLYVFMTCTETPSPFSLPVLNSWRWDR